MPEAVIVSTARSPIGRAFKGSLVDFRPDDLTATIIKAALDKVPGLDPKDINDLILGCGLPGGEQGYNMARVVAVLLGHDTLPGTTITRYCSSSLQSTRMAFHAIKAGEGDAFISAGVEMVSRFVKGNSDSLPDTTNPVFADAQARSAKSAEGGVGVWHDPREDGQVPDIYIAMGQTAENLAGLMGLGPVEASKLALKRAGMSIGDIDLVEINEAFAAQVIPSYQDLGIDIDKLNVNGGAIAVGHPFGMTGARITGTLINGLQTADKTFGVETMCVGGGQGMAMVLERLS